MKTMLSPEHIIHYQENGFVKISKFLDSTELNYWRQAIDTAVHNRAERIPDFNDDGGTGDAYYDKVFKQRVNLWRTDPAVKTLVLDKNIGRIAAQLEDINAVRIWHDQALYKGPWANPTSWHNDDPYWSFHSRNATTIWIALDDTTIQNGALYFMPGKHKDATFDNVNIGQNVGELFDIYPQWKNHNPAVIEMKAGDASFHNGLTPHAAGPNMTPHSRRAFAIIYMPDGSTFNGQKNILPDTLFESLSAGDILDDDDFNPTIYSRVRTP